MALDTHTRRAHPTVLGLIFVVAFIELVMSAYLVGKDNDRGYPNGSIRDKLRFAVFTSLWTFLFSGAYIAFFLTAAGSFLASIASHAAFFGLTWIFWTATAGSVTAALGGGLDCGGFNFPDCNTYNAVEAFAWIEFILFTVGLVYILFLGARSARNGNGFGGSLTD